MLSGISSSVRIFHPLEKVRYCSEYSLGFRLLPTAAGLALSPSRHEQLISPVEAGCLSRNWITLSVEQVNCIIRRRSGTRGLRKCTNTSNSFSLPCRCRIDVARHALSLLSSLPISVEIEIYSAETAGREPPLWYSAVVAAAMKSLADPEHPLYFSKVYLATGIRIAVRSGVVVKYETIMADRRFSMVCFLRRRSLKRKNYHVVFAMALVIDWRQVGVPLTFELMHVFSSFCLFFLSLSLSLSFFFSFLLF